jgi:PKD repeat protein
MSWDPEGDGLGYTWNFGDGEQGEGASVEHVYAQAGSYDVVLEVRDTSGAVDLTTATIEVTQQPIDPIAFRGASGVAVNATSASVRIPTTVQPGDTLLLSLAANRADTTLAAPTGWQDLGRQVDESMQSRIWVRVAQPGDAGTWVRGSSSGTAKMVAQLLAYAGTSTVSPIASVVSAPEVSKTAGHRTPTAPTDPSSWAVSLWSNKSSLTSGWTAPAEVAVRAYQGNAGSGRITSLAADSGGAVGTASYGGLTAVASQVGSMATMWTIVLNPR